MKTMHNLVMHLRINGNLTICGLQKSLPPPLICEAQHPKLVGNFMSLIGRYVGYSSIRSRTLRFQLLNRNVDLPLKYVATWLIDEWSKIGLHVTQRVCPTGPRFDAMRSGNFDVVLETNGHGLANPPLDVQKYLPASVDSENYGHYEDQKEKQARQTRSFARLEPRRACAVAFERTLR